MRSRDDQDRRIIHIGPDQDPADWSDNDDDDRPSFLIQDARERLQKRERADRESRLWLRGIDAIGPSPAERLPGDRGAGIAPRTGMDRAAGAFGRVSSVTRFTIEPLLRRCVSRGHASHRG